MNENGRSETRGVVVVGVDGSDGASAALRWAADEARRRDTVLLAVHAWTLSYPRGEGYGYLIGPLNVVPYGGVSDQRRAAEKLLERATAQLGRDDGGIQVVREVVEGPAAEVLVDSVTEDDLLVVGTRGHGAFVGALLGSVSQRCAHLAPCPVVIVPEDSQVPADPQPVRLVTSTR